MVETVTVPAGLVLTEAREGTFLLPALDNAISRQIIETGTWAADDVALFRRLVKPGWNVLDIGANVGHHSVALSRMVGAAGSVLAFEPQQRVFNFLCANLALNSCHNVRPFQVAVGDAAGFIHMCPADYSECNWGALPISKEKSEFQRGERVTLVTIDAVLNDWPRRIDFAKIDVQTFELFVLRGAEQTIRRDQPVIFVEISPYWMRYVNNYDHRDIYAFLRSCGYRLLGKDLQPLCEAEEPGGEQEWDVVAVPHQLKIV